MNDSLSLIKCQTATMTETIVSYVTICSAPTTQIQNTETYSHIDYETSTYNITSCPPELGITIYYYSTYSTTSTTPVPTTVTIIAPTPEISVTLQMTQEILNSTLRVEAPVPISYSTSEAPCAPTTIAAVTVEIPSSSSALPTFASSLQTA